MTGVIRGTCLDFGALVNAQYLPEDVEDHENYV